MNRRLCLGPSDPASRRLLLVVAAALAMMLACANHASAASRLHGFRPQAFTAISRSTWWVLGWRPCAGSAGRCTALVRTGNGGRTFASVPVPASTFSTLAFANRADGYLVDQAGGIWMTRDGGGHWHYSTVGGVAEQIVAGSRYVFVTTVSADSCLLLLRATAGTSHWQTLTAAGEGVYGVSLRDDRLLVSVEPPIGTCTEMQTTTQTVSEGQLLSSDDWGSSFAALPEPSGVSGGCLPEQPGSLRIWLLCPATQGNWQSTDAGATYAPLQLPPGIGWFNGVDFFDRRHGLAFGGPRTDSPQDHLYRTTDGGMTYKVIKFQ